MLKKLSHKLFVFHGRRKDYAFGFFFGVKDKEKKPASKKIEIIKEVEIKKNDN